MTERELINRPKQFALRVIKLVGNRNSEMS